MENYLGIPQWPMPTHNNGYAVHKCYMEWAVITFYDLCPYELMTYMYMCTCMYAQELMRVEGLIMLALYI